MKEKAVAYTVVGVSAHAFHEVLPESAVLFDAKDTRPYEWEGLSAFAQLPIAACFPPHSLYSSSQIACSIGSNVAENLGGVYCLKYGMTVHNVMGMCMVTIEGDGKFASADAVPVRT